MTKVGILGKDLGQSLIVQDIQLSYNRLIMHNYFLSK